METTVEFHFDFKEEYKKILFEMPDGNEWHIDRSEINPDISLAPWHYQKANIKIRESYRSDFPISRYIDFYSSCDFGVENLDDNQIKTLADLFEFSNNRQDMDFSEYLLQKKTETFANNYDIINRYYQELAIEKILLDKKKKLSDWASLKRICNDNYVLFLYLKELKENTGLINADKREIIIQNLRKIDRDLDDGLKKLDLAKIFKRENNYYIFGTCFAGRELNRIFSLDEKIKAVLPSHSKKIDILTLLPKVDQSVSHLGEIFELKDLETYCADKGASTHFTSHININNYAGVESINTEYNLLSNQSTAPNTDSNKEQQAVQKHVYIGDVLTSTCRSFNKNQFVIVDGENSGRLINESLTIVGKCTGNINARYYGTKLWSLLRKEYIREQISACADVNVKELCYNTLFGNVFENLQERFYPGFAELSMNVASLLCEKTMNFGPLYLMNFTNRYFKLINTNFSRNSLDYYSIIHKLNMLAEYYSPIQLKKCVIIHNDTTKKVANFVRPFSVKRELVHIGIPIKELRKIVSTASICIISLTFDDAHEVLRTHDILDIVKHNHIFVEQSKNTGYAKKIPDKLLTNFGLIRFVFLNINYGWEIEPFITSIIHNKNYLEDIFKHFLLDLSKCTSKSLKHVKCKAFSPSQKLFIDKEFLIFSDLQPNLIHLAYNYEICDIEFKWHLVFLQDLNQMLHDSTRYESLESIWKSFKKSHKIFVNERTIKSYVDKYSGQIRNNKEQLDLLYKIKTDGIKKFDQERKKKNPYIDLYFQMTAHMIS